MVNGRSWAWEISWGLHIDPPCGWRGIAHGRFAGLIRGLAVQRPGRRDRAGVQRAAKTAGSVQRRGVEVALVGRPSVGHAPTCMLRQMSVRYSLMAAAAAAAQRPRSDGNGPRDNVQRHGGLFGGSGSAFRCGSLRHPTPHAQACSCSAGPGRGRSEPASAPLRAGRPRRSPRRAMVWAIAGLV